MDYKVFKEISNSIQQNKEMTEEEVEKEFGISFKAQKILQSKGNKNLNFPFFSLPLQPITYPRAELMAWFAKNNQKDYIKRILEIKD